MFLTASNVLYYLRDAGLAAPSDLLDHGMTISEFGRRNRNFRVDLPGGTSLFVKQVPSFIPETTLSFMREAACAQLAVETEGLTTLRGTIPVLRRYDPTRQILIYELFAKSQGYADAVAKAGNIPDALTDSLALVLAGIHRETMRPGLLDRPGGPFTGEAPWIFIIGEKAEMVMPNMSAGCRQVVEMFRQTPELYHGLMQVGQRWQGTALMHGDLKWDNLLIAEAPDGARDLRVIDWELANRGDPFWDVAGAMGAMLQNWLFSQRDESLPATVPMPPGIPFPAIRTSASRFWNVYMTAMRPSIPMTPGLALHIGHLTGARMALLAFEILANSPTITFHAGRALQLARYFFADTTRAVSDLLGIEPVTEPLPVTLAVDPATPWRLPAAEARS